MGARMRGLCLSGLWLAVVAGCGGAAKGRRAEGGQAGSPAG